MATRAVKWLLAVLLLGAVAIGAAGALSGRGPAWLTRLARRDGPAATTPGARSADELYATFCASCHGPEGRGDGVAAPFCRIAPADFTRAEFKVRSTVSGALPLDQDLRDVIRRGAGGDGAMPSFDFLAPDDVDRLIDRVKAFSSRWQRESAPARLVLPRRGDADPRRGAAVYQAWGCVACHGASGAGDGPRARELRTARGLPDRPTDLTKPHTFKAGVSDMEIARSVLTGFNGTTMPAFPLQRGDEASLWDLAAYVQSLRRPRAAATPATPAAAVDTTTVEGHWSLPVPAQARPVSASSCTACHTAQFGDWSGARHALAMSPGVWAQMNDQRELAGTCLSCHAPLQDQWDDDFLMSDGVSCAGCHMRGGQVHGPPARPTTIAPLVAAHPPSHGPAVSRDFFEQSAFCGRCHQFTEGSAPRVNGAFLQNTLEEWRTSRAAREGKTCQSCHMPDRRHLFRGIHDPETVRAGVTWTFEARRAGARIDSRMTLTNSGTGHAFPTYIVPEVWMRIEALNEYGGTTLLAERLIGRRVTLEDGNWRELGDTRLAQDASATLTHDGTLPPGTVAVAGSVIVRPDAYHERSLAGHLAATTSDESRRQYEHALAEMRQSAYVLFREVRAP